MLKGDLCLLTFRTLARHRKLNSENLHSKSDVRNVINNDVQKRKNVLLLESQKVAIEIEA